MGFLQWLFTSVGCGLCFYHGWGRGAVIEATARRRRFPGRWFNKLE